MKSQRNCSLSPRKLGRRKSSLRAVVLLPKIKRDAFLSQLSGRGRVRAHPPETHPLFLVSQTNARAYTSQIRRTQVGEEVFLLPLPTAKRSFLLHPDSSYLQLWERNGGLCLLLLSPLIHHWVAWVTFMTCLLMVILYVRHYLILHSLGSMRLQTHHNLWHSETSTGKFIILYSDLP